MKLAPGVTEAMEKRIIEMLDSGKTPEQVVTILQHELEWSVKTAIANINKRLNGSMR